MSAGLEFWPQLGTHVEHPAPRHWDLAELGKGDTTAHQHLRCSSRHLNWASNAEPDHPEHCAVCLLCRQTQI